MTGGPDMSADPVHPDLGSELTLVEANPILAALACRSAAERGIRVLVIKGMSLEAHGLRANYVSSDVDILVEPSRCHELVDLMVDIGWERRPFTLSERLRTHHSITLLNESWPNDLDLHTEFPGFLIAPAEAFEVLWRNRVEASAAGHSCWIPDRYSTMVIWALHSLRSSARYGRHERELRELLSGPLRQLSESDERQLIDRIWDLAAARPLQAVPEFAKLLAGRATVSDHTKYREWRSKVTASNEASPWLQLLRDARWWERPWLLARAIWPSSDDLRLRELDLVDSPLGRSYARLLRLSRFLTRARRKDLS